MKKFAPVSRAALLQGALTAFTLIALGAMSAAQVARAPENATHQTILLGGRIDTVAYSIVPPSPPGKGTSVQGGGPPAIMATFTATSDNDYSITTEWCEQMNCAFGGKFYWTTTCPTCTPSTHETDYHAAWVSTCRSTTWTPVGPGRTITFDLSLRRSDGAACDNTNTYQATGSTLAMKPPTNVFWVSPSNDKYVTLNWTKGTDHPDDRHVYYIYRNGTYVASVNGDQRFATVATFQGDVATWGVRSVSTVNGQMSSLVTVTGSTLSWMEPFSVAASDTTWVGKVRVTWSSNSWFATHFRIYRNNVLIATIPKTGLEGQTTSYTYDDFSVSDFKTYTYAVRAYNSAYNMESVGVPDNGTAYPILTAASDGLFTNRVKVSWFNQQPKADEVKVYRDGDEIGTVSSNATVFYDYDAVPGKVHRYTVAPVKNGIILGSADDFGFRKASGRIEGLVQTITTAGINHADVSMTFSGVDTVRRSLNCSAAAAFVNAGKAAALPGHAATIEFWVKKDMTTATTDVVFDKSHGGNTGLRLALTGTRLDLRTNATVRSFSSASISSAAEWKHIAVAVDSARARLYVDGVRKDSIACGTWTLTDDDLFLGNSSAGTDGVKGLLEDIRVWSVIRSDSAIAADRQRRLRGDEPGLVHYWPADNLCTRASVLADLAVDGGRHGVMTSASLSADAPDVRPRAQTDINGFYSIKNVYYTENANVTITPYKASGALVHGFKPASQERPLEVANPTQQQVNFIDTTTFAIEGYVKFPSFPTVLDPRIGVDSVEILVNGSYYGAFTRSGAGLAEGGKFQVAVEEVGWYEIRPRYLDHQFVPPFIKVYVDDHITGPSALQFTDTTTRWLHLRARAAARTSACNFPMGNVEVAFNALGTLANNLNPKNTFVDTTNIEGNLPDPDGAGLRIPAMRYKLDVEYIHPSLPVTPATRMTRFIDMRDDSVTVIGGDATSPDTVKYSVEDTQYFEYHSEPQIGIESFWDEPCATNPFLRTLNDADSVRVEIWVTESYPDIYSPAGPALSCNLGSGKALVYNDIQEGFSGIPDTLDIHNGRIGAWIDDTTFIPGYWMKVGHPNIYPSFLDSLSFRKNFYVDVATDDYRVSTKDSYDLNIAVLGERSLQSTFTTKTPEIPIMILRRPPGDGSSSKWQRETTSETSWNLKFEQTLAGNVFTNVMAGAGTVIPFVGKSGVKAQIKYSLELGVTAQENYTVTTTTKALESIETPKLADYANLVTVPDCDVFMGGALNLVYAKTRIVRLKPGGCGLDTAAGLAWGSNGFATTYMYTGGHIRDVVIPTWESLKQIILARNTDAGGQPVKSARDSADIIQTQSIDAWYETLHLNDSLKQRATQIRNISFSAGIPYTSSESTVNDTTFEFNMLVYADMGISSEVGGNVGEFNEVSGGVGLKLRLTFGGGGKWHDTKETTTEYTLNDDDVGDYFSVDVKKDGVYGTPVFDLVAGTSSCPWEEGTQSRDGTVLVQGDPPQPIFTADRYSVSDILPDEPATFILTLTNPGETNETRFYSLWVDQLTNIDGAIVKIGGVVVQDEVQFVIPPGVGRKATMTIERGPVAYDYNDIQISMYPSCDVQVCATKSFSVHFLSPCSAATIIEPANNFLVNQASVNQLRFRITDLEKDKIGDYLVIEYRKIGTDKWKEAMSIPKNNLVDEKFQIFQTLWQIPPEITDGQYDLRVKITCTSAVGGGITYSNVVNGTINRTALQVYGTPEPADGILNFGDEISAVFSHDLDCGSVSTANVTLMFLDDSTFVEPDSIRIDCKGNSIVIIPTIALRRMQNRQLLCTVDGIADLNGNFLAAPVQWSFRVNRNRLVWNTSTATASVYQGSSASLIGVLRNVGGRMETFALSPTREWLTPLTTAGTLPPAGTQDIIFLVGDKLNPGTYRDTVYALTADGDEPLYVEVRVLYKQPEWTVNPRLYQHTMEVTGQVMIDTVLSADQGDMLAAFVGSECRGVTNMQYVPALDVYRAFLTVHSDERTQETVTFRSWDASTGKIYTMQETFPFDKTASHGTLLNPVIFHPASTQQNIAADSGWTWFSLNTVGPDMSPNAVLANTTAIAGDLLKGQTTYSQYSTALGWVGSVDTLRIGPSYKLKLTVPGKIQLDGAQVSVVTPIPIVPGWNWIGYLPGKIVDVNQALFSLAPSPGDLLKGHHGFAQYSTEGLWQGNMSVMTPGEGYLMRATSAGTLVYPAWSAFRGGARSMASSAGPGLFGDPGWTVHAPSYEHTMNVTSAVVFDGAPYTVPGSVVAAFVGDQCRGVAQAVDVAGVREHFLTAYANAEGETVRFRVYAPDRDTVYEAREELRFTADGITGTPDEPFALHISSVATHTEQLPGAASAYELRQNYPNPFNPSTVIAYAVPSAGSVRLELRDALGRLVAVLADGWREAGVYAVRMDRGALPSGIYTYTMRAGDFMASRRMTLVR